jgi:hypothetical protein
MVCLWLLSQARQGILQDVPLGFRAAARSPAPVRESQFQAERPLSLRTRNSAAYKGLYALVMKRGGRDFRTGDTIDAKAYMADSIDIRHIFPQKWCAANNIDPGLAKARPSRAAGLGCPSLRKSLFG